MNRRFFVFLNFISAILMLLTFFSSKTSPVDNWLAPFLGFVFPYLLIINFIFIIVWLLTKRRFLFISLIAIIVSHNGLFDSFSLPVRQAKGDLTMMSYNVKNFDLYNWSRNKESRAKMLEIIQNESPDILCFQEFFTNEKEEYDNIKKIHNEFGYKHFHYEEATRYLKNHWGAATFSRYPIVNKGRIEFDDKHKNICLFTDIKIDGEIIRVYNLHLVSYHMVDEDYDYLKALSDFERPKRGSMKSILNKLTTGFKKRSLQAEKIKKHIDEYDGYKIVCGDFNDIPISYSYQTISSGLKDAFSFRAAGMGKTFVSSLPSLRIDYILVDPKIEVDEYRRLPYRYSDHYPIMISFSTN